MPRPPRTDGLFEPNLLLQFFLTGQELGRLVDRAVAPIGMQSGEYVLLSAVDELEPVIPSDVSRLTGLPRQTLTRYIERLVSVGYVMRLPNLQDDRSYMLVLTAEGQEAKQRGGLALKEALDRLTSHLEDSPEELTAALARLRAAAEAALEPSSQPG